MQLRKAFGLVLQDFMFLSMILHVMLNKLSYTNKYDTQISLTQLVLSTYSVIRSHIITDIQKLRHVSAN
jgi:hypothetical protein